MLILSRPSMRTGADVLLPLLLLLALTTPATVFLFADAKCTEGTCSAMSPTCGAPFWREFPVPLNDSMKYRFRSCSKCSGSSTDPLRGTCTFDECQMYTHGMCHMTGMCAWIPTNQAVKNTYSCMGRFKACVRYSESSNLCAYLYPMCVWNGNTSTCEVNDEKVTCPNTTSAATVVSTAVPSGPPPPPQQQGNNATTDDICAVYTNETTCRFAATWSDDWNSRSHSTGGPLCVWNTSTQLCQSDRCAAAGSGRGFKACLTSFPECIPIDGIFGLDCVNRNFMCQGTKESSCEQSPTCKPNTVCSSMWPRDFCQWNTDVGVCEMKPPSCGSPPPKGPLPDDDVPTPPPTTVATGGNATTAPVPPPTTTTTTADGVATTTTPLSPTTSTTSSSPTTSINNASDSPPTSVAPTTEAPSTTTAPPQPAPPLPDDVKRPSEDAARGVLTIVAALMSPFIGPSGIFDTTRALVVYTFARCSHQGLDEIRAASTQPVPFPESFLPFIGIGPDGSSYFRGALLVNLIIIPLIALIISVSYGAYRASKFPGKLPPLPGPPPSTPMAKRWEKWCEWMFYGSTLTTLVVIFAIGWDGSVAAIFSIFGSTVESGDSAGDFILSLLYLCVVCIFLIRVARQIYLSTPTRFFMTPGCVKKKLTKKPMKELSKASEEQLIHHLNGWWGRLCVVGDFVWRPGSIRSYRQFRECMSLYRRFWGPRDEDRALMGQIIGSAHTRAQTVAAKQDGVTPSTVMNEQQQQSGAAESSSSDIVPKLDENGNPIRSENGNDAAAGDGDGAVMSPREGDGAAADPDIVVGADSTKKMEEDGDGQEEGSEKKTPAGDEDGEDKKEPSQEEKDSKAAKEKQQQQKKDEHARRAAAEKARKEKLKKEKEERDGPSIFCESPEKRNSAILMYSRRSFLVCFFFLEFIFVFCISLMKGLARVSENPDACFGLARASAAFNLIFLILIVFVRPFAVPARNACAIISSLCATIANFMAADGATSGAAALAIVAAVVPIICFLIVAVPRLMMRFYWGFQHVPGKHVMLRDPTKPPAPPPSEEQQKAMEQAFEEKKRQEAMMMSAVNMKEKELALAAPLLGQQSPGGKEGGGTATGGGEGGGAIVNGDGNVATAKTGDDGGGPLSRLARIFFPPPPGANSSDAGSVGGATADYDLDSEEDDDDYLSRILGDGMGGGGGSEMSPRKSGGRGAIGSPSPRDTIELSDVHIKLQSLQQQISDVELLSSPRSREFGGGDRRQFQMQGFSGGSAPTPFSGRGGGGGGDGRSLEFDQKRAMNPRVAQEVALAQLVSQICSTRNKASLL